MGELVPRLPARWRGRWPSLCRQDYSHYASYWVGRTRKIESKVTVGADSHLDQISWSQLRFTGSDMPRWLPILHDRRRGLLPCICISS